MSHELLTTREVAKLIGVGTTSIKRWSDSNLLRCVKTPGGHRRFRREAIDEFMTQNHQPLEGPLVFPALDEKHSFLETLTNGATTSMVVQHLLLQRQELGSWLTVAESLSNVLGELGRSWARGEISVLQEHIASERLTRALSQCAEKIEASAARDLPGQGRTCLAMVAESDEHTLGLQLAELCLREAGWRVLWVGRKMPVHAVCEYITESHEIDMLAVSASEFSRDAAALADQAGRLGLACQRRGIPLLLGGMGAWPERPGYGQRLRSFDELRSWLHDKSLH